MKKIKWKNIIIALLIVIIVTWLLVSALRPTTNNDYRYYPEVETYRYLENTLYAEKTYSNRMLEWQENGIEKVNNYCETIISERLVPADGAVFVDAAAEDYEIYNKYLDFSTVDDQSVVKMAPDAAVTFTPAIAEAGLYALAFAYYDEDENILPNEIGIMINGEYQYYENRVIKLYSDWLLTKSAFSLDRYNNEILPSSRKKQQWQFHNLTDSTTLHRGDFCLFLNPEDEITIFAVSGNFYIADIMLKTPQRIQSYEEYRSRHAQAKVQGYIEIPVENFHGRNDPSIRLRSERDSSATSYHVRYQRLNVVDGVSWCNGGQEIEWSFPIERAGLYQLSFKYRQDHLKDMPVFRQIKINEQIPYDELTAYPFPYAAGWVNRTVTGPDGESRFVYLPAGENTISLTVVLYPYRHAIETIRVLMNEITDLSLAVKKMTGNIDDAYRDWDIEIYLPDSAAKLKKWASALTDLHNELALLSTKVKPAELSNLLSAAKILNNLSKDVNKLPSRLVQLSDGDSSAMLLIGDLLQRLMTADMELEKIMIHSNEKLPRPRSNIFVTIYDGVRRLFFSFIENPYHPQAGKTGELTVWVNHPRQYIEIMQTLIDGEYDGPMRVVLSQMPSENKLILANATGRAPDVAIGVNHWIPYEFAIRNAALDLRRFSGYQELVGKFTKGALIPYVFEEGVYGLPETQNFWVTFYRTDIMANLGIDTVPQTWDEIIAVLPQLQRYGFNYFSPVSMFEGFKPFVATLPFIYQFGGNLYTEGGMATAINSPETLAGMELMSELFTLYNLPKRVPNFYNHFRYGMLPLGISDLSTYLLLTTASPELAGLWEIDLHPGVPTEDGIIRYAPVGAQSSMIIADTEYPSEAWHFLNWWMSTEVQVQFAYNLQTTYGQIYFWNTANLEAFARLPLPDRHKEIILQQWEYGIEASRIPGVYMVEREISNAWNKIVFDGVNPRYALDEAVRISNREIIYKMEEFGYARDGVRLKDYNAPSIYNIDYWLTEVDDAEN